MTFKVAIQMDALDTIDIAVDSTFALALEGQDRGHMLYHYLPSDLSMKNGSIIARARILNLDGKTGNYFLEENELLNLSEIDVVLMRQDPPFDMSYITATHLLERIHPYTLVVNNPSHVRNAPEKLFVTEFQDLTPPTLITRDQNLIKEFRLDYRDVIIKPLYGNGGAGVFHIEPENENLNALVELFFSQSREPLIIQQYLPEIRDGDKRIILVDGVPVGAVSRVPMRGEARANLHVGATAEKATINHRDQEICNTIGPILKEKGLLFVGIDVIGCYLTEINVTSPTGIKEINQLNSVKIEEVIWDSIEKTVAQELN